MENTVTRKGMGFLPSCFEGLKREPLWPVLVSVCAAGNVFQQAHTLANSAVVGRMRRVSAFAAVNNG